MLYGHLSICPRVRRKAIRKLVRRPRRTKHTVNQVLESDPGDMDKLPAFIRYNAELFQGILSNFGMAFKIIEILSPKLVKISPHRRILSSENKNKMLFR